IDAPDRLWTAGGSYAALAAARSLTLAGLVVAAFATHALPVWPVFVLVGTAAAVALAAVASTRFRRHHRVASFLAGIASLAHGSRSSAGRRSSPASSGWSSSTCFSGRAGTRASRGRPTRQRSRSNRACPYDRSPSRRL